VERSVWLSLALRGQVAFTRPAALVMGLGVVEVAAYGPPAAAGCGAGRVSCLDQMLESAAGPVAVLGLGVLAGAANDRIECLDVQEVPKTADGQETGRPWPGRVVSCSPGAGSGGAGVGGGGAVGVQDYL
jgi:hypothetical protein